MMTDTTETQRGGERISASVTMTRELRSGEGKGEKKYQKKKISITLKRLKNCAK